METSPHPAAFSSQQVTRKAIRSALKSLDDAMKLGAHPLAALRIVDVQRVESNHPDNQLGCGLALRDLLRRAVETLRPDDGAPRPQKRAWRRYLVAQEYVARRNPHDLQVQMCIAASTYDHEQAAMLDHLVAVLSEWEIACRKTAPDQSEPGADLRADWGEMRDVTGFCGRAAELKQLRRWVTEEQRRLIAVVGLGGVGKTALLEQLTTELAHEFDAVIWRSLVNAPPIEAILRECVHFLAGSTAAGFDTIDDGIRRLIEAMRARRCLLILDNLETLFQANASSGQYRPGYEAYGQLISSIGECVHQSCLLLTSREASSELIRLETSAAPARILRLKGMMPADVYRLLQHSPIYGDEDAWKALTRQYAGNPLALLLTAYTIQEFFDGDIAHFLREESTVFGDIRLMLDAQISRLSTLEQEAVEWLVVAREPISVDALLEWFVEPVTRSDLLSALQSLHRRSLIESQAHHFSLQNMVLEYGTERLVERLRRAIIAGDLAGLDRCPLMQNRVKEYVRQSQERMLVQPLFQQLLHKFGNADAVVRICFDLLKQLRISNRRLTGYAAGNLLNLLQRLPCSLEHINCAGLTIREVDLRNISLQGADFSHARFVRPQIFQTIGAVSALAGAPDGAWLAIGAADGQLALWRVDEDSFGCIWPGHDAWILGADFSPDGALLATASEDQTVKLWAMDRGTQPPRCVHTLRGHTGRVRAVAFQPVTAPSHQHHEPIIASGGDDGVIILWSIAAGQPVQVLRGEVGTIRTLTYVPHSDLLVSSGNDYRITVWNVRTGCIQDQWLGHDHDINKVACHPNGQILISGGRDTKVHLWRLSSARHLHTFHAHNGPIGCLASSPDGRFLATTSEDQMLTLWDTHTYRSLWTVRAHRSDRIRTLYFSPDGATLYSGAEDHTVRVWDVCSGNCLKTITGYMNWINAVAFHPSGEFFASCGHDGYIRLWRTGDGARIAAWRAHSDRVNSVTFHPQGRLLVSASNDCTIQVWDIQQVGAQNTVRRPMLTLQGHTFRVRSVAFSPDGQRLVSGGNDQTVRLWDIESGRCLRVWAEHHSDVTCVAFHPTGLWAASGSYDRTVRLWSTAENELHLVLPGHRDWVRTVAFHPVGRILASAGDDRLVRLWEVDSGRCIQELHGHSRAIRAMTFTADGAFLITAGEDRTICIWDMATGRSHRVLQTSGGAVSTLALSPTAPILLAGHDEALLQVWDLTTHSLLRALPIARPYEGMKITGARGLSPAQRNALLQLGAIDGV